MERERKQQMDLDSPPPQDGERKDMAERKERRKSKEGRRGVVKTLTSNLVTVFKKATCTAGPRAASPHCSPRGHSGHQLLDLFPFFPRSKQSCAHTAAAVVPAQQALQLVCWSQCQGEGWTGQMAGENTKRLVSNKKENSSLYIVVCFGSVQTE